jgi:flagellar L-ring protein precursor FlgH
VKLPRLVLGALLVPIALTGCSRLLQIGREPPLTPPGQLEDGGVVRPTRADLTLPRARPEPAPAAGSLWQPVYLFSDRRARTIGDLLTVVIQVDDEAAMRNRTERARDAEEDLDMSTLFGIPQEIDEYLPGQLSLESGVGISSESETLGAGAIARDEKIELKIAATVTDVLPNGNLAIVGSQEMRVNYELRNLQIAGIIRREDITRENTIDYEQIAEARLVYGGRGQVYDLQQPRYGEQVLDVLLPF